MQTAATNTTPASRRCRKASALRSSSRSQFFINSAVTIHVHGNKTSAIPNNRRSAVARPGQTTCVVFFLSSFAFIKSNHPHFFAPFASRARRERFLRLGGGRIGFNQGRELPAIFAQRRHDDLRRRNPGGRNGG